MSTDPADAQPPDAGSVDDTGSVGDIGSDGGIGSVDRADSTGSTEDGGGTVAWHQIVLKTAIWHTATYMLLGLVASTVLDYESLFAQSGLSDFMRPLDDRRILLGPLLQPIRGVIYGGVLVMLRPRVFESDDGWLVAWALFWIVGVLVPFGPAPGSFEGAIYTTVPIDVHLRSLPETTVQTLLLATGTWYWVRNPNQSFGLAVSAFTIGFSVLVVLGLLIG